RVIAKTAFRLRALNDFLRVELIEGDRSKIRAGYSLFIHFSSMSWSAEDGFKAGPIFWRPTIKAAAALTDAMDVPPIRVPGFILRAEQITPLRTLRPTEYQQLWNDHDLDGYLHSLSEIRGERRCLNCLLSMSPD